MNGARADATLGWPAAQHEPVQLTRVPQLLLVVVALPPAVLALSSAVLCPEHYPDAAQETRFLYPALVIVAMAVGMPNDFITRTSNSSDEFRAIVAVGRDAQASGVLILDESRLGTGGFFYLGRNIPWPTCERVVQPECTAALTDPRINRALARSPEHLAVLQASGFRPIRRIGQETILAR